MLTKSQIASRLEELGVGKKTQMTHVLNALTEIAREEVAAGEDFTVPGIARVSYRYTTPRKKGEEYVGFGGINVKADKARPEKIALRSAPVGAIKQLLPRKGTKAFKNVVARKAR